MAIFEEHRQELLNEILRATSEEDLLHNLIDSEAERAIQKEDLLETLINSEVSRATSEEKFLQSQIDSEALRLDQEILRATSEENLLHDLIDSESNRAIAREDEIEEHLNSEASRLDEKIDNETLRAMNSEEQLRQDLNSEIQRAISKENYLEDYIISEGLRIDHLTGEINSEISRAVAREDEIEAKIPVISPVVPIRIDSEGNVSLLYDQSTLSVTQEGELKVIGGGSSEGGGGVNFTPGKGLELVEESEGKVLQFTNAEDAKIVWFGTSEEYAALGSELDPNTFYFIDEPNDPLIQTTTYNRLVDQPQINGITLSGNKTLSSLGIQPTLSCTAPISVAANNVSLNYNEDQFYLGPNNKLSFSLVDESFDVYHMITLADGFVGIISGFRCVKYAGGLYVGQLTFMNNNAVSTGDVLVGRAFGDGYNYFNGGCIGYDETNHYPIVFEAIDGELHMYVNTAIPARQYITLPFTFVIEEV